jgi:DNA-binding NarL/FixJ family response regulator
VDPIRVFISDLPQMLGEIVSNIVDSQDDMQIVSVHPSEAALASTIGEADADVLLLGCEGAEFRQRGEALLRSCPQLKVVAVVGNGRESYLLEFRPRMVSLGEVSPEALVDAIRDAVGPASQFHDKET